MRLIGPNQLAFAGAGDHQCRRILLALVGSWHLALGSTSCVLCSVFCAAATRDCIASPCKRFILHRAIAIPPSTSQGSMAFFRLVALFSVASLGIAQQSDPPSDAPSDMPSDMPSMSPIMMTAIPTAEEGNPVCFICGAGSSVGNPGGIVAAGGQASDCATVELAGLNGLLSPFICATVQTLVDECACSGASVPSMAPLGTSTTPAPSSSRSAGASTGEKLGSLGLCTVVAALAM